MKAMVCEMCSSHDLVKQDGLYVCQHCGTKYSTEEARKLFVEGSIKIDHSDEIQNLYELARRARRDNNVAKSRQYYEMLLLKEPFNWEPVFYSGFYSCSEMESKKFEVKAEELNKLLDSVIPMIESLDEESKKSALIELQQVFMDIVPCLINDALDFYKSLRWLERNVGAEFELLGSIGNLLFTVGDAFRRVNMVNNAATLYKSALQTLEASDPLFRVDENKIVIQLSDKQRELMRRMDDASNYVRQIEPGYMSQKELNRQSSGNKKSGCYVATAVYGSYDCPQVWTLRRFRDNTLAETWYGRAFIRAYYAISPTLVKWFGKTEWFKNLWKPTLDRMVEKLNGKGVEDTPYDDRAW